MSTLEIWPPACTCCACHAHANSHLAFLHEGKQELTRLRPSRPYTTSADTMLPNCWNMGDSCSCVYAHGRPCTTTCSTKWAGQRSIVKTA
jgi:hypothetical protein